MFRSPSIPNCRVVAEPAPDLIRRSVAAIGLNSTVVLETVALDRDLIMPVFAEAAGKYADKVYFPHFRDVFSIANSRAELSAMLERVLRGERLKTPAPERLHALLDEYVGNHDGRSAERLAAVFHDVVRGRQSLQIRNNAAGRRKGGRPGRRINHHAGADRVSLRRFSRNRWRSCCPLRRLGRGIVAARTSFAVLRRTTPAPRSRYRRSAEARTFFVLPMAMKSRR